MSIDNFDEFYFSHYSEIFRYCQRLIQSREDAEDLTETAFIKAYYHFDPHRNASFRTFIFLIATNLCKDFRKSIQFKLRRQKVSIDEPTVQESVQAHDCAAEDQEIIWAIHHCLDRLPLEEQICIRLYYVEGFTLEEIAEIIGKSANTVKNRLKAGITKLKICLEQHQIGQ